MRAANLLIPLGILLAANGAWARGEPRKWEFGVGALAMVQGSFFDEGEKKTLEDDALVYPGFAGVTGGGGLALSGMYKAAVGLELDLIYSRDSGNGDVNFGPFTADVNIGQWALHIPLLVKAAIPFRTVRPFVLLGPEFVIPMDAEADSSLVTDPEVAAKAEFYTVLTAGIGLEILLPVEGVDLRIPLSLRGRFNFGTPETVSERIEDRDPYTFNSEWQYQAAFTIGFAWYYMNTDED